MIMVETLNEQSILKDFRTQINNEINWKLYRQKSEKKLTGSFELVRKKPLSINPTVSHDWIVQVSFFHCVYMALC